MGGQQRPGGPCAYRRGCLTDGWVWKGIPLIQLESQKAPLILEQMKLRMPNRAPKLGWHLYTNMVHVDDIHYLNTSDHLIKY